MALAVLGVVWVIVGERIPGLGSAGDGGVRPTGSLDLGISESPFPVTMADQYLCFDGAGAAQMSAVGVDEFGDPCLGPFTDSVNLCRALEERGEDSVRLLEGHPLHCD